MEKFLSEPILDRRATFESIDQKNDAMMLFGILVEPFNGCRLIFECCLEPGEKILRVRTAVLSVEIEASIGIQRLGKPSQKGCFADAARSVNMNQLPVGIDERLAEQREFFLPAEKPSFLPLKQQVANIHESRTLPSQAIIPIVA